jgi:predicted nucleic acid-binding Zn ribbon protein
MRATGPKHLDTYLSDTILKRLGRYMDQSVRLRAIWSRSVEEPLGSHSHPVRFSEGKLIVHADSSAWASRLRQRQQELLSSLRLHAELQELKKIQIRVQPLSRDPAPASAQKTGARGSRLKPQLARLVREVADGLTDPGLRGALRRLGENAAAGKSRTDK